MENDIKFNQKKKKRNRRQLIFFVLKLYIYRVLFVTIVLVMSTK